MSDRTFRTLLVAAVFAAGYTFNDWMGYSAWPLGIGMVTAILCVACKTDFI